MLQPMLRRVALGAMQAALAEAGILVIMLLFSRPAHAANAALPPLRSAQTTTGLTVTAAASPITSIVSSTVPSVIAHASGAAVPAPVTSTAAPVAKLFAPPSS